MIILSFSGVLGGSPDNGNFEIMPDNTRRSATFWFLGWTEAENSEEADEGTRAKTKRQHKKFRGNDTRRSGLFTEHVLLFEVKHAVPI